MKSCTIRCPNWSFTLAIFFSLSVALLVNVGGCVGAKFLLPATSLMSTPSHYMGLTTITQALVKRGHEVTLLIIDKRGTAGFRPKSYTDTITYPNPMSDEKRAIIVERMHTGMTIFKNKSFIELARDPILWQVFEMMYFGCFELFKNDQVLDRLKNEDFDMIITFPVTDFCDAMIAAFLDISYVVISGTRRVPIFHEGMMGMPAPNSYVPFSFFNPTLTNRMTFAQRVSNAVFSYGIHGLLDYFSLYRPIGQLQALYGIRPDLTPWQMVSRADLWLVHYTWALEYPNPTAPNWIPIAGYTIKEPKALPIDLESFIEGAGEHGFIVFSLGSMTVSLSSEAETDMFAKVFSELPQRVLWRYIGPASRYLGNNTLTVDWLPQNDLLAHPKARLLIYHAGSAGVHEAINYGVPMLLLPLIGDQPVTAWLVAEKGMGIELDLAQLDEEMLRRSIHTLLHDNSYKKNAMKASAILRDRIASPLDTAVFWIEHVVKFGGGHLRSPATEMGFIQLHSLDVAAFLVVLCSLWAYLSYVSFTWCCKRFTRKQRKPKND